MLDGLISIAGGILAASALIVARKPNAQQLIDKLTPYTGWIGIVMFCWGVYGVLNVVRFISFISAAPVLFAFAAGDRAVRSRRRLPARVRPDHEVHAQWQRRGARAW